MPALYMSGFVRDDADQLIRRLRLRDRARVDEHMLSVDHERIERGVVDQVNLDIVTCDVRRLEDWRGVVRDKSLGFGIADKA